MLWEASKPYLYLSITEDQRLLAGGADDAFHEPALRDRRLATKVHRIAAKVRKLIPSLSD